jgi:flavin reductase (DIM6/NTAB) family NADH-FMN oxidoreductase RutF
MDYDVEARDRTALPHDPIKALVGPRPIGWMTTVSAAGVVNLAPYSFFNQMHTSPAILAFGSDGKKDSVSNLEEVGEFVWNFVSHDLREAMNATSASLPRDVSEAEAAGIAMTASRRVRPPRVTAARAALECRLVEIVRLKRASGEPLDGWMALGEVVAVHIDDAFIRDGRVVTAALDPILRGGYMDYFRVGEGFAMKRPA